MPKPRDVLMAAFARIKRAPIPIGLVLKPIDADGSVRRDFRLSPAATKGAE